MKPDWLERDNIQRRKGISVEEFVLNFEELNKPVRLERCLENWAACEKWDRDYLVEACDDVVFSVGPVEMKLEDFSRYSDQAMEERPLYLFDLKFMENVPRLDLDYEVPVCFNDDLFSVLGTERPDYRWIIIKPWSGSSFHIDPNSTSAWNAVIKGSKKWVMFPHDIVLPGVHPSLDDAEVACPELIIEWFMNFYSATKKWKKKPIKCVCKAGDITIFANRTGHADFTQPYSKSGLEITVLIQLKLPNQMNSRKFNHAVGIQSVVQLVSCTRTFNCPAAQKHIGYIPIVSVKEGVNLTLDSFPHLSEALSFMMYKDFDEPSKLEKLLSGRTISDIWLWRDENKSFTHFLVLALLYYWFFLSGSTFVSSTAKLLLLITVILFGYGFLPSNISGLTISEVEMKNSTTSVAHLWKGMIYIARSLAQGED